MYARATLVEIDTTRIAVDDALEQFRAAVLPTLRTEPGYQGTLVLSTGAGKGLLLSFRDTPEQAEGSSFYSDVIERFMVLFRAPPGREHYEVRLAEMPASGVPTTG